MEDVSLSETNPVYKSNFYCSQCKSTSNTFLLNSNCVKDTECYANYQWPNSNDINNKICDDCDLSCSYACLGPSNTDCMLCDYNDVLKYFFENSCYDICPICKY